MKNPVILAIVASAVVFVVMYYWYNPSMLGEKGKKNKEKKSEKDKKKREGVNETVIISAAIAGLATWYIASSYFAESTNQELQNSGDQSQIMSVTGTEKGKILSGDQVLKGGAGTKTKIPRISSDDPTRSYNLIGSGLNIPRSELNIPPVLIDYK